LHKNNEIIISHVSNFRPVKNIKNVILIFNNIQNEIPSKLLMIGEGPEKLMAEKLCKDLSIEDKVQFLGNSNNVEKNLCHSDLFLLPSNTESFGLAALEAMASKVAIISSNAGGLPEINLHEKTGYLTEPDDVEKMSDYSISLLSNQNKLNDFKNRGFKRAEKFDINKVVPMYEKVYLKALKFSK
jgi:N-acetyl-alpha-D-glucosaminyl L-malate synthase BshA